MTRTVEAAGGVVWRPDGPDVALAVVHRPRYDDWSLPKGKRLPGEHLLTTAQREVAEETGQRTVLGRSLGESRYRVVEKGVLRPKTVSWWSMRATGGSAVAGPEVDDVRWVPPREALRLLTYRHEAAVVEQFLAGPPEAPLVLLVRHASAGDRAQWTGDDDLRPLDDVGRRQADALAGLLGAFAPQRLLTAPPLRCAQTLAPLAEALHLSVEVEPLLGERAGARVEDVAARVRRCAAVPPAVLCSQGGVVPEVVAALDPSRHREPPATPKASLWVVGLDGERLLSAAHVARPLP